LRTDLFQQHLVTPGGIGHHVMQRLVHPANVVGRQTRSHGLHALAFPGQQQARAIRFQRTDSVSVPCGVRQAIEICRKALLLWAWH